MSVRSRISYLERWLGSSADYPKEISLSLDSRVEHLEGRIATLGKANHERISALENKREFESQFSLITPLMERIAKMENNPRNEFTVEFRSLNEEYLANLHETTVTTIRRWLSGQNTPSTSVREAVLHRMRKG